MSSCTDPLHLNEKRLFKELKRSLSGNTKETHNILEIRDDVLYVWNADKCCVQTLNVGATRGKFDEDVTYQGNYIATLVDDTVADPSSSDDAGGGATATGTTSTAPSSSDSDSKRCRHLYPRDPPAR
ncbi:hypothetical protein HZH68_016545 [Vespula germanica]|uniref:Uncharacterized protein n=1 Tax=Vespula germanica TaxID=30212 RepID=A0A834J348_VESGE|nr:hypothetical protein HZH68_016545 [Vespula germanica]